MIQKTLFSVFGVELQFHLRNGQKNSINAQEIVRKLLKNLFFDIFRYPLKLL